MEDVDKTKEELQRTKEDLADLEKYIDEFTSFLPIVVCTVNPAGVIIDVNAAFEKVTGYSSVESIGQKAISLFKEANKVEELLNNLSAGKSFGRIEVTLMKKDGSSSVVSLTASARTNRESKLLGYFLGMNDITELKNLQDKLEVEVSERTRTLNDRTKELEASQVELLRALEAVQREREKNLSILSNLTDGLIFVNTQGLVELINPHAESLLAVRAENVVGRRLQEQSGKAVQKVASLMGEPATPVEREQLSLGGDSYVEVSVVPVAANETTSGNLIVLHDVSRERALENLKVEFISVAAHQMRTPLSAINWAFELLISAEEKDLSPKLKSIAVNGFESTQRILKIVNNFLDVSQIESTNLDYTFAPVDLKKVVVDIFSEVEIPAEEKGVSLVFLKDEIALPYLNADQKRLETVMQNLIENALKYTIQKGTITVDAVPKGREMLISVADEGIGIPDDEKENIFTKFYRADNARKVETDGNGLGLYMTKRIIERHGGKIWFESTEKGTTFFFTIPLLTQDSNHGPTSS